MNSQETDIRTEPQTPKKRKHPLREVLEAVLIAFVIAFVIRSFLFQPFWVPSTSMVPTLNVNDRIIVNEIGMRFREVQRGDIMVFEYPHDPSVVYVKRIVGLPGDTVEIRSDGVYIDGQLLEEPYLNDGYLYQSQGPLEIPEDAFFALGDNRGFSADSRVWGFVPAERMIGRAVFIYWPLGNMGPIR